MRDALLVIDVFNEFDHADGDLLLASFRERKLGRRSSKRKRPLRVANKRASNFGHRADLAGELLNALWCVGVRQIKHPRHVIITGKPEFMRSRALAALSRGSPGLIELAEQPLGKRNLGSRSAHRQHC